MEEVVLVIHLILALSIIGLVLLQRSEGGGLGIGGGGGLGGLATPQGAVKTAAKLTGFCAAGFFCTSLILGVMAGGSANQNKSVLDALTEQPAAVEMPLTAEPEAAPEETSPEAEPSAPKAE